MKNPDKFDVIIVGAGPAGCTLAIHLAEKGHNIAVFEKEKFPRKKICGDALSGKVINILKRMPGEVYSQFLTSVTKTPSDGIRFVSPGNHQVDLLFPNKEGNNDPSGYLCPREIFDHFLFSQMSRYPGIHVFENMAVDDVIIHPDCAEVTATGGSFFAEMVVAADGVHSVVRKKLTGINLVREHICLGLRGYYSGIPITNAENMIELRFLKTLLPGYLWVFRHTGGQANIGFGIPMTRYLKQKRSMVRLFAEIQNGTPEMAGLFASGFPTEKLATHPLPLATCHLKRSGERFILLGDAGYLVDPFSGEGIGNAMGSAESAVPVILDCFSRRDFSATALRTYESRLARRFGDEFRVMAWMQRLVNVPGLMDFVVRKATKNTELKNQLAGMFTDTRERSQLTNPAYYLKLLLK
jgi:geranylgeranyl reductase family protein